MKVGKAIYNILSQSTDVQSNFPFNTTDYAPTGTELVTNGDFSAAGINLVSNPNFTDSGADLLTQPIDLTIDFDANSGGVIVDADTFTTAGGSLDGLLSKVSSWNLVSGKSYKLVIAGSTTSSGFTIGDGVGTGSEYGSDFGTHYFVSLGTRLWIRQNTSGTTDLTTFTIEELGADWTVDTGGTDTVTFANDQVQIISDGVSGATGIVQPGALTLDKSYKITIDVASNSNKFKIILGGGSIEVTGTGVQTFYGVAAGGDLYIYRIDGQSVDADINSILIQELGEGWTLGTGWSIGEDKAIFSGTAFTTLSQSTLILESTKSYKVTFSATVTNGSFKLQNSSADIVLSSVGGNFVEYFTAGSTSLTFARAGVGIQNDFTITNITVQEMILTKIFPELAPPDIDAPYIVYSVVSNSPSETKNANGDIDTANIEVYGFQDTYNKAVDLGVSVRAALDRKTGTYNTIQIQSTNYVNEQMDVNEARKLWAAIQDYSIRIKNI